MKFITDNWRGIVFGLALGIGLALFAVNAKAADLGGSCCADLEERIAELEATTARRGSKKVSLTISGQVNAAIAVWDNDIPGDGVQIIDNATSGSRVTFDGSAKINPAMTAGYVIEIGRTPDGSQLGVLPDLEGDAPFVRRSFLYVDTGVGRVALGKVEGASFGITELTTANTDAAALPLNILGFSPFGGVIQNNVRYDTPSLMGFVGSASFGTEDDSFQLAARWGGEFSGIRVVAGIGYTENDFLEALDAELVAGSASAMHLTSGLFLTAAFATNGSFDDPVWHLQGGIERNFTGIGRTTFFGEYADIDDAELYGLGVVQAIDAAALDLYLTYRNIEDVDQGLVGARMRF